MVPKRLLQHQPTRPEAARDLGRQTLVQPGPAISSVSSVTSVSSRAAEPSGRPDPQFIHRPVLLAHTKTRATRDEIIDALEASCNDLETEDTEGARRINLKDLFLRVLSVLSGNDSRGCSLGAQPIRRRQTWAWIHPQFIHRPVLLALLLGSDNGCYVNLTARFKRLGRFSGQLRARPVHVNPGSTSRYNRVPSWVRCGQRGSSRARILLPRR